MGLASSACREFFFIQRKSDIALQLNLLANDKVSLSREMQKVSAKYQEALNTKTLKWSNNAGVSYSDISYGDMMRPGAMNQNVPYIITDTSGRVVLDSAYEKYAQMISPDGSAKGDWDSNRSQILSELTGVDKDTIDNYYQYDVDIYNAELELNAAQAEKDKVPTKGCKAKTASAMMSTLGKTSVLDWQSEFPKNPSKTELGGDASSATTKLNQILDDLNKLAPHFGDYAADFTEAIKKTKEATAGSMSGMPDPKDDDKVNEESYCYKKDGKFYTNISALVEFVLGQMPSEAKAGNDSGYGNAAQYYFWENIEDYNTYKKASEEADKKLDAAKSNYNSKLAAKAGLMTADQERTLKFYDELFSTIADKGWVSNDNVNDSDYLNEMFQNNLFMITTVDRSSEADLSNKSCNGFTWKNNYSTDIASNNSKIFTVNDSDVQNEAMVEYEYEKSIISAKESKIDTRMDNLKTEQSAIQQMLQGIEQVKKDNIERTMSWCG